MSESECFGDEIGRNAVDALNKLSHQLDVENMRGMSLMHAYVPVAPLSFLSLSLCLFLLFIIFFVLFFKKQITFYCS